MQHSFSGFRFTGFYFALLVIIILSCFQNSFAQNCVARVEIRPNKWILINEKGEQIGEHNYGHINIFSEGLAAVRDHISWGYINANAEMVIPARYLTVYPFSCGIAAVSLDIGEFKYINKTGKTIIPGPFAKALLCTDSLFFARKVGEYVFRLFNYKGKEINPQATYNEVYPFSKGYAIVRIEDEGWQIINKKGEVLYKDSDCSHINNCQEGMFAFRRNGKWGFIDSTFKIAIPPVYTFHTSFSQGYSRVQKDGKWMLIDKTGKSAEWSEGYEELGNFSEGLVAVKNKDNLWGFINTEGTLVIPYRYTAVKIFKEGIVLAKKMYGESPAWGYINKKGEVVINFFLYAGKDCKNGFVFIKSIKNGKWGFVTSSGVWLPGEYIHGYSFEKQSNDVLAEETEE